MVEPSSFEIAILMALQQKKPGEVYAGTVSPKTKMQRRGTWGAYERKRRALRLAWHVAQRSATARSAA